MTSRGPNTFDSDIALDLRALLERLAEVDMRQDPVERVKSRLEYALPAFVGMLGGRYTPQDLFPGDDLAWAVFRRAVAEGRTYTVLALTLMEFGCYFSPLMQSAIVAGIERHPLLTGSADDAQEPAGGTAAHRAEVVRVLALFRSYHPDTGSQERQKVASEARRLADRVLCLAQFPRLTRGQQSLH